MEEESEFVGVLQRLAQDPASLSGTERVDLIGDLQRLRGWVDAREALVLDEIHHNRDDVDAGARDITQLCQQQANVAHAEAKRRALRSTWTVELPSETSTRATWRPRLSTPGVQLNWPVDSLKVAAGIPRSE